MHSRKCRIWWNLGSASSHINDRKIFKKVDTTSRPDLEKRLLNAYFLLKPKPSDTLRIKYIKDSTRKAKNDSTERKRKNNNNKAENLPLNRDLVLNKDEREENN